MKSAICFLPSCAIYKDNAVGNVVAETGRDVGRLRERAKRDESDSGDGSGNVSGPGLDLTGSGHSSRRVQGL